MDTVAWRIKMPLETPAHLQVFESQVVCFASSFPPNASEKAADAGSVPGVPAIHVGDLNGTPGSCFRNWDMN